MLSARSGHRRVIDTRGCSQIENPPHPDRYGRSQSVTHDLNPATVQDEVEAPVINRTLIKGKNVHKTVSFSINKEK